MIVKKTLTHLGFLSEPLCSEDLYCSWQITKIGSRKPMPFTYLTFRTRNLCFTGRRGGCKLTLIFLHMSNYAQRAVLDHLKVILISCACFGILIILLNLYKVYLDRAVTREKRHSVEGCKIIGCSTLFYIMDVKKKKHYKLWKWIKKHQEIIEDYVIL